MRFRRFHRSAGGAAGFSALLALLGSATLAPACLILAEPPDLLCDDRFDCPSGDACDDGICVAGQCDYDDDDCIGESFCEDRLCIPGCQYSVHCDGNRPCIDSEDGVGRCVDCQYDFDCPDDQRCRADNTCS